MGKYDIDFSKTGFSFNRWYCDFCYNVNLHYFYDSELASSIIKSSLYVIKDICDNEGVDIYKLNPIVSSGNFSSSIVIGNKVFKYSFRNKLSDSFCYNPYVIADVIRKEFNYIKENNYFQFSSFDFPFWVEVQEKVDVLDSSVFDEGKLYQLYKGIRDLGLIWLDVKPENVGVLLRDNNVYWNLNDGQRFPTMDKDKNEEALGLLEYRNYDIYGNKVQELKKGQYVIIDNDDIYDEFDSRIRDADGNFKFRDFTLAKRFEERYMNERKEREKNGIFPIDSRYSVKSRINRK